MLFPACLGIIWPVRFALPQGSWVSASSPRGAQLPGRWQAVLVQDSQAPASSCLLISEPRVSQQLPAAACGPWAASCWLLSEQGAGGD